MKRTFIAIKIRPDEYFKEAYNEIRQTLSDEHIRWVRPENFHITLRFLGDTSSQDIQKISSCLSGIVHNTKPFVLRLSGLGVFRSLSYPRVLYMGLADNEALREVRLKVDSALDVMTDESVKMDFSPHLTLGRMNRLENKDLLREVIGDYHDHVFLDTDIREIIFFESILSGKGAEYSPLSVYHLI